MSSILTICVCKPEQTNIRNYILKKNEFRVFVNHENKSRHRRENMLRIFTNIFKTNLNLQEKVGKPCICFYSQQGVRYKNVYTRSSSEEPTNENDYGT